MKIQIEFDESDEDQQYLRRCLKSTDLCLALHDIQNRLRDDDMGEYIDSTLDKYGIILDDLIT